MDDSQQPPDEEANGQPPDEEAIAYQKEARL